MSFKETFTQLEAESEVVCMRVGECHRSAQVTRVALKDVCFAKQDAEWETSAD